MKIRKKHIGPALMAQCDGPVVGVVLRPSADPVPSFGSVDGQRGVAGVPPDVEETVFFARVPDPRMFPGSCFIGR